MKKKNRFFKKAIDISLNDVIQSPHTSNYWLKVERIEDKGKKKITFFGEYVSGECKGRKWAYSFMKTTNVTISV